MLTIFLISDTLYYDKVKNIEMAKNKWINQDTNDLFSAILQLKDKREALRFFRDLLTESEIIEFGQRWKAANMLSQGVPYTEIEEQTGLSSTTIARVQKWLSRGMGGYKLMIKRLGKR